MNQKSTILVFAVVALGLDAVVLVLQSRQFHAAETFQDVLTKKNASLQSTVNRLKTELRDAQAKQTPAMPIANAPENGSKYIPVRVDAIKDTNISILDSRANPSADKGGPWILQLSSDAIGWLGLTSAEASQVQSIFSQLQDHIEKHFSATAREIPDDDEVDRARLKKAMLGVGQYSYYAIPPLDDDDVAYLQQWLSSSLTTDIGQARADILSHDLTEQYPWFQPGTRILIGFRDITGRADTIFKGETYTDTMYLTIENVTAGTTTKEQEIHNSRRVLNNNAVPPELNFLFEPVSGDPNVWRRLIAPGQ